MRVLARLKPRYPHLGVQDFYQHRTVEALAARLEAAPSRAGSQFGLERSPRPALNLSGAEVRRLTPRDGPPATVLLTGATGYLGAHLLHSLLRTTSAHVLCLVRPAAGRGAAERLADTVRYYFPEDGEALLEGRVTALAGDLERERLGLEAATWERLAGSLDAVVHCGAEVRYFGDVAHFRQANVESTQRLLALARQGGGTRFHHISTLGLVGHGGQVPADGRFTERMLDWGQDLGNLYTESKFLAETLVADAAREGLPVTVYRLGNILGHSRTGRFQRNLEDNAFLRKLKATVLLGASVQAPAWVDLSPVDYCAAAVVHLAGRRDTVGRTLHICNPVQISHETLMAHLRANGHAVELLHPEASGPGSTPRRRRPVTPRPGGFLLAHTADSSAGFQTRLDCQETRELLEGTGVDCPAPDAELLGRLLRHAVERGYFPPAGA